MDASICSSVTIVSTLLSRHLIATLAPSSSVQKLVHASLFFCLSLFALTVLDAAPHEWNIFMTQNALTYAYRVVLWMIALQILIVTPLLFAHHLKGWKPTTTTPQLACPVSCGYLFYSIQFALSILSYPVYVLKRIIRRKRKQQSRKGDTLPVHLLPENEVTHSRITLRDIISGVLAMGIMWFVLHHLIGPLSVPYKSSSELTPLTRLVSCLSTIGILLSAVLNGFGSVSLPFQHLSGMFLEAVPDHVVVAAEQELEQAAAALQQRQEEFKSTTGRALPVRSNSSTNMDSFITMGNDITTRKHQLQSEIDFLQGLVGELVEDVTEMRLAKVEAARARTRAGKIRSVMGITFSIVLLVRLAVAFWNLSLTGLQDEPRATRSDPVTLALAWMLGHQWVTTAHYNSLSQFLSLILTAILTISQMNTFIRTVAVLNRRFFVPWFRRCICFEAHGSSSQHPYRSGTLPTPYSASSSLLTIMVTLLMTCYCLACVVLTKNMVPPPYRQSFSQALGAAAEVRPYPVHLTFAVSACISLGILTILLGIQRQNTQRYNKLKSPTSHDSSFFRSLDP
ncbi:hypothetical protein FisN_4Lh287 [Fistulifera solaris]|uniref:Abscisic acid G-protein coupled receptor-like domain-containing protein n=1 Tax=Fistulifera solaris TaxID=1519565 RepID=A0A1Z5KD96_FISSO|nr:hypothetical protein FisN_4Lh287 [Fistulifera solaris]|eukprot:GAX24197.1 hypothetical protein FisN_4Lh287 [Fistulifera solaris]